MAGFAPNTNSCRCAPPVAYISSTASALAAVPTCAANATVTARSMLLVNKLLTMCCLAPLLLLLVVLLLLSVACVLMSASGSCRDGNIVTT